MANSFQVEEKTPMHLRCVAGTTLHDKPLIKRASLIRQIANGNTFCLQFQGY